MKVTFEDVTGDGEGPWTVSVDNRVVIEELLDMDVSARALEPLWLTLGIEVKFRWGRKRDGD